MKINNVTNNRIDQSHKTQSFNGLGGSMVNGMVKAQNAILGAGIAATFVCQDFLGSEAPRIITGLFRNSDKTGHLNYNFAAMEACRELLTAPPMMFMPIATFALANKFIGGATKSPVSAIESFSEKMANAYNNGASVIKDTADLKQKFYATSWTDALKNSCGGKYEPKKELIDKLSGLMVELENSKNYTLIDKIKKVPKFRTTKDITGDITNLVSEELKSNANVKKSFSKVVYKDALGKKSRTGIGAFIDHMSRFAKDSIKSIGDVKSVSADDFLSKLKTFTAKRSGARVLMNFATMAAAILYVTQVPKIYKSINKTNPGLIGLVEEEKKDAPKTVAPVDYEAFDKLKKAYVVNQIRNGQGVQTAQNGNQNTPAFKGLGLGKIADALKNGGGFRKFANAFEFNGIDMSFATLMGVMGLGVVYPRVKNAYDKHDKREILTRDLLTLSALIVGAKALLKTITRGFEKVSGMAMTEKAPNYAKLSTPKRIFEHLRPFGGVQVYSNSDIILKYSDVDKYKGGFEGFCKYVSKSGGNLVKLFGYDKTTKTAMETMLGKSLKQASEKDIMSAIKNKNNAKYVNDIVNVFKDKNNTFIRKAKSITGVFGFVSTFIAVPAFMIFLQKFNEKMTKKAIAKEQEEKNLVDQKFTAIKLTTDLMSPDKSTLNMK